MQSLCQNASVNPFLTQTGTIAVINEDNIDTDRIIPARFLSRVSRSGYGELLFADVRNESFPLDQARAKGAKILVVGTNFGCGSSREHAVWAIQQAGFIGVIARKTASSEAYSDIFRQNSANCGLLLIELDEQSHDALVAVGSGAPVTVSLEAQTVTLDETVMSFQINPGTREALMAGLDLIGTTLVYNEQIASYEDRDKSFTPTFTARS